MKRQPFNPPAVSDDTWPPTDAQRQAHADASRELPAGYYVVCAIVVLAILGALHVVCGPWGFAMGLPR